MAARARTAAATCYIHGVTDLGFRFVPGVTLPGDLDEAYLRRRLGDIVRAVHPERAGSPHQGPPVEEVVVRSIVKRSGWYIHFGYILDTHPGSRYDKSQQAEGTLRMDAKGQVLEVRLGPLRYAE